jgi:hypothetical protein
MWGHAGLCFLVAEAIRMRPTRYSFSDLVGTRRNVAFECAARQSRGATIALLCLITASIANPPVFAQYVYNPASADEGPGIKYFGSAKDTNGALLPDVSIQIRSDNSTIVLVTDIQGRFRKNVALDMEPEKVTLKCFKEGYQLVHLNKRLGPSAPKQTVQIDCVLRATSPK